MQIILAIALAITAYLLFTSKFDEKILERAANVGGIVATAAAIIVLAFYTFPGSKPQEEQATATPQVNPTSVNANTPTPIPTQSITAVPSETLVPTSTPFPPTDTLVPPTPEFYLPDVWVPITSDIYATMHNDFENPHSGRCFIEKPSSGFAINFEVKSASNTNFILRFDPSKFHVEDDLGHKYTLFGAGNNRCDNVGPQVIQGSDFFLIAGFTGQLSLDSHYLIITADSINGVRLVFHKSL